MLRWAGWLLGGCLWMLGSPLAAEEVSIEQWLNTADLDLTAVAGIADTDDRGAIEQLRANGEPVQGFTLAELDISYYAGAGQLWELHSVTPGEESAHTWLAWRRFGLGRFEASWFAHESAALPTARDSRWTASRYALTVTAPENVDVIASRDHRAVHSPGRLGPLASETHVHTLQVPFRFNTGTHQGAVRVSQVQHEDRAGRFSDVDTLRAAGSWQVALTPTQFLAAQVAESRAEHALSRTDHHIRRLALGYSDLALGGDPTWRWELRGDWQETGSTVQLVNLPESAWNLGTRLTWTARPWRITAGYTQGEQERYRLSAQAFQELLLNPERDAFERGVYLAASPRSATLDATVRYQPDRQWLATVKYREQRSTGLPETALGTSEVGTVGQPLWFTRQARLQGSLRYQLAPLQQVVAHYTHQARDLAARDSHTSHDRWDLYWQDASRDWSYYLRVGGYDTRASREAVTSFTTSALLYGGGGSLPLGQHLRLDWDCTWSALAGSHGADEFASSLSAEYQLIEDLELLATWTHQTLGATTIDPTASARSDRFGLFLRWRY